MVEQSPFCDSTCNLSRILQIQTKTCLFQRPILFCWLWGTTVLARLCYGTMDVVVIIIIIDLTFIIMNDLFELGIVVICR